MNSWDENPESDPVEAEAFSSTPDPVPPGFGGQRQIPKGPKQGGLSPLVKVLITLGIIALLFCCLCGGGAIYWVSTQELVPREDAAAAQQAAREILGRDVPETMFAPSLISSLDLWLFKVRTVQCRPPEGNSDILVLIEIELPQNAQRNPHPDLLQQQRMQHASDFQIRKMESRVFNVRGNEVTFKFIQGQETGSGRAIRVVEGMLPTPRGMALFLLQTEEARYDEQAVVEFLESLGEAAEDGGTVDDSNEESDQEGASDPVESSIR